MRLTALKAYAADVERTEYAALVGFVGVGIAIALAPAIPLLLRFPVLILALVLWAVTLALAVTAAGRGAWRAAASRTGRTMLIIGVVGAAVAVLAALELFLIRWLGHRPALTWYFDWRWALGHARAIARYGGVDSALDYSGVPINYHPGPSWLAGAVERMLGADAGEIVLFCIVPLLSTLSLLQACTALLARFAVSRRTALAATVLAITFPLADRSFSQALGGLPGDLLVPPSWTLLVPGQMLNSALGLALGAAAFALAFRRLRSWDLLISALGFAALSQIKPQYFVGFGAALGLLAIMGALRGTAGAPRSWALVWMAGGALALALIGKAMLPGDVQPLTLPVRGSSVAVTYAEVVRISSIVAIVALLALFAMHRTGRRLPAAAARLGGLIGVVAVVALVFEAVFRWYDFPFRPQLAAQLAQLGLAATNKPFFFDNELLVSVQPVRLLLLLGAFALLATILEMQGRAVRAAALAGGLAITSTPLLLYASPWIRTPTNARQWFEVAEDPDLRQVLRAIPRGHELVVSSDLADPAQDYARPLRSPLLTAYGGHQFFVSNLRYVHFARPDAPERLMELRTFYGAAWSAWHEAWLTRRGITHVLVNARCEPAWQGSQPSRLREIASSGDWRAYEVLAAAPSVGPQPAAPAWTDATPKFGRGDCLFGGRSDRRFQ